MGELSEWRSCLLEVVVIMRVWWTSGSLAWIALKRSWIGVDALVGSESVRGRPSPAKVVSSTFTVRSFAASLFGHGDETSGICGVVVRVTDIVMVLSSAWIAVRKWSWSKVEIRAGVRWLRWRISDSLTHFMRVTERFVQYSKKPSCRFTPSRSQCERTLIALYSGPNHFHPNHKKSGHWCSSSRDLIERWVHEPWSFGRHLPSFVPPFRKTLCHSHVTLQAKTKTIDSKDKRVTLIKLPSSQN